ncbi:tetratricopeptide repeat protein [Sphingomonas sp.]|uniref:tetratricopeptide repeat protein n=1 Tax=Sphingomonas sp. TaxID=28214 RepID=UPI0031CF52F7
MGWLVLLGLAAGALGLAVKLGLPRPLWTMLGAALALGGVGYAWQGRPMLSAGAAAPRPEPRADNDELIELRGQLLGRYGGEGAMFMAADALAQSGNSRTAVQIMLGAVGGNPRSVPYWTELGNVLFAHDGYQMSPAAQFAFRRARVLGPNDPAPFFFEGLAWMRTGDFRKARLFWNRALQLSPANAPYRPAIEQRVLLLDQAIRMMGE